MPSQKSHGFTIVTLIGVASWAKRFTLPWFNHSNINGSICASLADKIPWFYHCNIGR